MKRIGILSDTHGYLHPRVFDFFSRCDEIWHAGDIGSLEVIDILRNFKPTLAVWGNIDDYKMRSFLPEKLIFDCEGLSVLIIHIAGRPGKYSREAKEAIKAHRPGLLVAGHSHILQVKYDAAEKLMFINPGAAGIHGFHHKITMLRLAVDAGQMKDLEVFEIERNNGAT
jgi:putative phosphoesterase